VGGLVSGGLAEDPLPRYCGLRCTRWDVFRARFVGLLDVLFGAASGRAQWWRSVRRAVVCECAAAGRGAPLFLLGASLPNWAPVDTGADSRKVALSGSVDANAECAGLKCGSELAIGYWGCRTGEQWVSLVLAQHSSAAIECGGGVGLSAEGGLSVVRGRFIP